MTHSGFRAFKKRRKLFSTRRFKYRTEVLDAYKEGMSYKLISEELGVRVSEVKRIVRGFKRDEDE